MSAQRGGRSPVWLSLAACSAAALGAIPLAAQNVTVQASADTTLKQDSPNKSFGSEQTLILKKGGSRVLVHFDPTAVAAAVGGGSSLASAQLQVYVGANAGNWGTTGRTVDIYRLTTAWGESGATWNCADDPSPGHTGAGCTNPWVGGTPALYAEVPASTLLKEAELLARGDLSAGLSPSGGGGRRGRAGLSKSKYGAPGSRLRCSRWAARAPGAQQSFGPREHLSAPVADAGRKHPTASPEAGFSTPVWIATRGTPAPRCESEPQISYAEVPATTLLKEAELLARGDLGAGLSPSGGGGRRGLAGLSKNKCWAPGSRLQCSRWVARAPGARQSFGPREHLSAPVADAGRKHPPASPGAEFSMPVRIATRGRRRRAPEGRRWYRRQRSAERWRKVGNSPWPPTTKEST